MKAALFAQFHRGQDNPWPGNLFGGCDDFRGTGGHDFTALVHRLTIENNAVVFWLFLRHLHRDGNGVAKANGTTKMQGLVEVDDAGASN